MMTDDRWQMTDGRSQICHLSSVISSVIEQKLPAIEQKFPEDIFKRLLLIGPLSEHGLELGELVGSGLAREAAEVMVQNPLFGELFGGDQARDHTALADLGVDGIAVEQVKGLRERRFHFDLARADGLAGCAPERGEEVRRAPAVGDLHGAGTDREPLELILRFGDEADRVEQVLRLDAPRRLACAKFRSSLVLLSLRCVVRWYVRELQISRTRLFRSYFDSVKCLPSSASSSGLVAGLLTRKSSTGSTMPIPRKWAQTRLANEVANHGFWW